MGEQLFNLKFVQEVGKRPCLYNHTLTAYSRKDITEKAWNEVGRETNLTVSECKEKWKNLRAVFVRHMKPAPSGSKSKKPYYLADAMQFALPFIRVLSTTTSGKPKQTQEDVHDDDEEENPQSSSLPPSSLQSMSLRLPSPQSYSSSPPASPQSSFGKKLAKKTKIPNDDLEKSFDEYLKAKRKKLEVSADPLQQANKMFLLSLLPDLNQISSHQIRMFKRKVIDFIDEVLENTPNSTAQI